MTPVTCPSSLRPRSAERVACPLSATELETRLKETTVFLWQSSSGAQGTPHAAGTAREKAVRAPTARTRPCPLRCSSPRRPSHRPTSTCSLGAPYCPPLKTVLAVLGGQRPARLLDGAAVAAAGGRWRGVGSPWPGQLSSEGRSVFFPRSRGGAQPGPDLPCGPAACLGHWGGSGGGRGAGPWVSPGPWEDRPGSGTRLRPEGAPLVGGRPQPAAASLPRAAPRMRVQDSGSPREAWSALGPRGSAAGHLPESPAGRGRLLRVARGSLRVAHWASSPCTISILSLFKAPRRRALPGSAGALPGLGGPSQALPWAPKVFAGLPRRCLLSC